MKYRFWLAPAIALLLLGMTACTLIDPIVVRGTDACDPVADKRSGAGCAAALRDRYLDAVSDRERLNALTNGGLLTLVTTFGVLAGLDHVDTQTILAGGIGGAALLVTPRVFGTDQRDFIYLAGAEAMSCVLDAGFPAIRFHDEYAKARRDVEASIGELELVSLSLPAIEQAVMETLAEARTLYIESLELERSLETMDARVLHAARSIDVQVNTALVQQRTDPAALATALGGSTTLVQGQISSFLATPLPQPGDGTKSTDRAPASIPKSRVAKARVAKAMETVAEARKNILKLTAVTQQANEVLSPFADSSLRKRCTIDSPEIRPLSADPRRLTMTVPKNGETASATIVVIGGKAPHGARFIGVRPTPADSLIPSVEETEDGAATLRVTATSAVGGGTFRLRIESKEGKTFPVDIVIVERDGGE